MHTHAHVDVHTHTHAHTKPLFYINTIVVRDCCPNHPNPATKYIEKFLEDKTVPVLKSAHVNNETALSIIASSDTHKATALFILDSSHLVSLNTILVNNCITSSSSLPKQAVVTPAV